MLQDEYQPQFVQTPTAPMRPTTLLGPGLTADVGHYTSDATRQTPHAYAQQVQSNARPASAGLNYREDGDHSSATHSCGQPTLPYGKSAEIKERD